MFRPAAGHLCDGQGLARGLQRFGESLPRVDTSQNSIVRTYTAVRKLSFGDAAAAQERRQSTEVGVGSHAGTITCFPYELYRPPVAHTFDIYYVARSGKVNISAIFHQVARRRTKKKTAKRERHDGHRHHPAILGVGGVCAPAKTAEPVAGVSCATIGIFRCLIHRRGFGPRGDGKSVHGTSDGGRTVV